MKVIVSLSLKIFPVILCIIAISLPGCSKKKDTTVQPTLPKGYIIVTCQSCQVQYGMPDQYHEFSVSGTSQKAYYTYSGRYTLVTYITALGQTQDLTLKVYNSKDSLLYHGTVNHNTSGYWENDVIVPADK